ncbi:MULTISPECIES: hypothetical protein [Pontibacillus]|uniref:Uncharacterized protein n=1 Tax=Pontibacillus chungwhensis TaxID=265426 RepID=A0ABY8UZR6_9BACI|nr:MULTISPECIES: hypothetical protein [Pontibacillus]MCD5324700.1 hypothetical protein [Pontibacillus sp. HN14]WIF99007.1 hypothetical protein QNI29_04955 [Pontibacillus chungwhensis]
MAYLLSGCFHWIGYHLTEALLNEGETVIGVDSDWNEQKEWLSLYVGRNASFHLLDSVGDVKDSMLDEDLVVVHIGGEKEIKDPKIPITFEWIIEVGKKNHEEHPVLYAKEVYGPWMPHPVKPTSAEALYVDDFIRGILEVIEQGEKKDFVEILPSSQGGSGGQGASWFVEETMNQKEGWQRVLTHQEQFPNYYKL